MGLRTILELKKILGFDLTKAKEYISDPSKAPEEVKVEQGPRGGYYYETGVGDTDTGRPDMSEFKQKLSNMDDTTLKSQIGIIEDEYPKVRDGFKNWYSNNSMGVLDGQLSILFGMSKESSRAGQIELDSKTAEGYMKVYSVTQEYLKRIEPDGTIIMHRGLGSMSYTKFKHLEPGEDINIEQYNVSSWTNDYDMALEFASLSESGGVVIETFISTKRVFLHPDCSPVISDRYSEGEIVLMGSNIKAVMGATVPPKYSEEEEEEEEEEDDDDESWKDDDDD